MIEWVLLLDRPEGPLRDLEAAFRGAGPEGCLVESARGAARLLASVGAEDPPSLVILPEEGTGDREPGALMARLHAISPGLPVVIVARAGSVDAAAKAVAGGATDFLVLAEPLAPRVTTLLGKLRGLIDERERARRLDEQNAQLRASVQARFNLVGESKEMHALLDRVRRIATVPRPVLITGERGTGKELVARAIHFLGGAATRPIVTVNCAAFSDALLESELFGHERGAFTGADAVRRGKFEQAGGGTLFLDEIGNMSLPFQQKILRVVEYGTFHRVGGSLELKADVRVLSATNVDLRERIRRGEFLGDLYDRLAFEVLEVPPLRARTGDVEVLARHFLNQFAREIPAFRGKTLSRSAIAALSRYAFPGNVRELKNLIERAAYRDVDAEIRPQDIGLLVDDGHVAPGGSFFDRVAALERALLTEALAEAEGNQAAAARLLGMTYDQFRYHHRRIARKDA